MKVVKSRFSGLRNRLEAGEEAVGAPVVVGEKQVEKCEGGPGQGEPGSAAWASPRLPPSLLGTWSVRFLAVHWTRDPTLSPRLCEDQMRQ